MTKKLRNNSKIVKSKRKFKLLDILMGLVLLIGIGILSYPFIQDALNDFLDQQVISYYQNKANAQNEKSIQKLETTMRMKNAQLAKNGTNPGVDVFSKAVSDSQTKKSEKVSNTYFKSHTIAVISIPKIAVNLPIFDETNDLTLQKGAALLEGTSYPIGGASTHSVISAHRGLSTATLFTKLPKMKIEDRFYIDINKERHAYQVEKIQVINPTNTVPLKIQKGRDLVTLMTCTPYMINTQRLLVTGHRIPYDTSDAKKLAQISWWKSHKIYAWILGGIVLICFVIAWCYHLFLVAALTKRRLDIEFRVLDSVTRKPVVNMEFSLMIKNGKKSVYRNGKPLKMVSDKLGMVCLKEVRGGKYQIVPLGRSRCQVFSIQMKKKSQSTFYYIFSKSFFGEHHVDKNGVMEIMFYNKPAPN